jgi:membrane-associated phospholipid phosphatase
MRRLLVLLSALYSASLLVLMAQQMRPVIPWVFVAGIALLFAPVAYLTTEGLYLLRVPIARCGLCAPFAAALGGLMILVICTVLIPTDLVVLPLTLIAGTHLLLKRRELVYPLTCGTLALVLMYGTIWNLNQAVGPFTLHRLWDAEALRWDLTWYGVLLGRTIDAPGMFPWLASPWLFSLLETAYLFLFCEVFVVVLVQGREGVQISRFIASSMAAYLLAIVVFFFYPIVGPYYFLPDTLAGAFHDTRSFSLMSQMNASYADILAGRSTQGFAYLVGLPSMHVTMAIMMQRFLVYSRPHFWAFLPINLLMALSTLYLGFHYLVDFLGGVVLAVVVLVIEWAWSTRVSGALKLPQPSRQNAVPNAAV